MWRWVSFRYSVQWEPYWKKCTYYRIYSFNACIYFKGFFTIRNVGAWCCRDHHWIHVRTFSLSLLSSWQGLSCAVTSLLMPGLQFSQQLPSSALSVQIWLSIWLQMQSFNMCSQNGFSVVWHNVSKIMFHCRCTTLCWSFTSWGRFDNWATPCAGYKRSCTDLCEHSFSSVLSLSMCWSVTAEPCGSPTFQLRDEWLPSCLPQQPYHQVLPISTEQAPSSCTPLPPLLSLSEPP